MWKIVAVNFLLFHYFGVNGENSCPSATLITSLHQKNCTDKTYQTANDDDDDDAYYLDRTSCIPKCSIYPRDVVNDDCSENENSCVTGYSCENRCGSSSDYHQYSCTNAEDCIKQTGNPRSNCSKYCILQDTNNDPDSIPCMGYHSNLPIYVNKYWTAKKFKPLCDDEGNWAAKQCKGSSIMGRCMCFSASGTRLFGQALNNNKDAENMTCACSRRKSELELLGRNYVSFHCDKLGNYENLQCDFEKSLCFCVDSFTGDLTAPVVPISAMTKLPCYLETVVGNQYLRQCESQKFASFMITKKLTIHGAKFVYSDSLLCDADGSFGNYMLDSGKAYCTWRDNSKIENYMSDFSALTGKLTCNCARDILQYGASSLQCESFGNYKSLQQSVTQQQGKKQYFCIDEDGFAKTDLFDDKTVNCDEFY